MFDTDDEGREDGGREDGDGTPLETPRPDQVASSDNPNPDAVVPDAVPAGLRAALAVDPAALPDRALCDAVLALEAARRLVDAAEGRLLAELDRRNSTDAVHGLATASWLAREAKLSRGTAKTRVQVGTTVARWLPTLHEALVDGRVSFDHLKVIAERCPPRCAREVSGIADELIADAQGQVFTRWQVQARYRLAEVDADGGYDPTRDRDGNRLLISPVLGGSATITGQLDTGGALTVRDAVDAVADELFRSYARDHRLCSDIAVPTRPQLEAEALVELARRARAVDLHATRAPRPEITLVASASHPLTGVCATDGTPLPDGTIRLLACDAAWLPLIVDDLGVPLAMGRRTRFATPAQRHAAAARDGGCVFPGCDAPTAWTELHHVHEFERGGGTDLHTMASLCRRHHGIVHRTGWTMYATQDAWFWWRTPSGQTIWSQRHGSQRSGPTPDPTTAVAVTTGRFATDPTSTHPTTARPTTARPTTARPTTARTTAARPAPTRSPTDRSSDVLADPAMHDDPQITAERRDTGSPTRGPREIPCAGETTAMRLAGLLRAPLATSGSRRAEPRRAGSPGAGSPGAWPPAVGRLTPNRLPERPASPPSATSGRPAAGAMRIIELAWLGRSHDPAPDPGDDELWIPTRCGRRRRSRPPPDLVLTHTAGRPWPRPPPT